MDAGKQLIDAQRFGEDDSRGRLKELRFDGAVAVSGHEEHDWPWGTSCAIARETALPSTSGIRTSQTTRSYTVRFSRSRAACPL